MMHNAAPGSRRRGFWFFWWLSLAGAVALVIAAFVTSMVLLATGYDTVKLDRSAMDPSIPDGSSVYATDSIDPDSIRHGDVVMLRGPLWSGDPTGADEMRVSRVVALSGDTIICCNDSNQITLNGREIAEEYLHHDAPIRDQLTETVLPGHVFVLNDWRSRGDDSRDLATRTARGSIPIDAIHGRVVGWYNWDNADVMLYDSVPTTDAFSDAGFPSPDDETSRWFLLGDAAFFSTAVLVLQGIAFAISGIIWLVTRTRRTPPAPPYPGMYGPPPGSWLPPPSWSLRPPPWPPAPSLPPEQDETDRPKQAIPDRPTR